MQKASKHDGDIPEAAASDAMRTVEQVPHSQRLRLDRIGQTCYQLTDVLTLERRSFNGVWELVCLDDDGGQAALAGIDENGREQVLLPADIFRNDVFVDSKGERFMVVRGDNSVSQGSLDSALAKYRDASLSLRLGCGAASASIECFVMAMPRACGQRVFFGLFGLYRLLALETFSGQPSKWTHAGVASWCKQLAPQLPGDHVVYSKHWNLGKDKLESIPWFGRCLPQTSCSSVACLLWLAQWGMQPKARGGLAPGPPRTAACGVLSSLLDQACAYEDGCSFALVVSDNWVCNWPGPLETFQEPEPLKVSISFSADAFIDFGELFHESCEAPLPTQQKWSGLLFRRGFGHERSRVAVMDFLAQVVPLSALASFTKQVLLHLSARLERCLAAAKDGSHDHCGMSFGWKSQAPSLGDPCMEAKLYGYVIAGVEQSKLHRTLTIATDKCSPTYQSLGNSVIVYPNGVAVLCCPQVVVGRGVGPQSLDVLL